MIRERIEMAVRRQAAFYSEPVRRTRCGTCVYMTPAEGERRGCGRMPKCGRYGFRVSPDGVCQTGYCPNDPSVYGLTAMKSRGVQLRLGIDLEEEPCRKTGTTATT